MGFSCGAVGCRAGGFAQVFGVGARQGRASIAPRRDVAQLGRALGSGRRGRGFESRHPDHRPRRRAVQAARRSRAPGD